MRFADRVARSAHVKEYMSVLEDRGGWMLGEIVFDVAGKDRRSDRRVVNFSRGFSKRPARDHSAVLPAHPRAQGGDMRGVVARVPVVLYAS